jgi:hypothetical protein
MRNLRKLTLTSVAGGLLLLLANPSGAQPYYGSQLMTPEERAQHRATMQRLSPGARQAYRAQHHEEMKQRAEAMGLSLPDQPPPPGRSFGRGRGAWGPGYGWSGPGYGGPGYGSWARPGPGPHGRGWRRGWGR